MASGITGAIIGWTLNKKGRRDGACSHSVHFADKMFSKLCFLLAVGLVSGAKFHEGVRKCPADQGNDFLSKCLAHIVEDIRAGMTKGIPELHIPPLDPMILKEIIFNQRDSTINVQVILTNLLVKGLSAFKARYVGVDIPTRRFMLTLDIPKLEVQGNYKLSGNVLALAMEGDGTFTADLRDVFVAAVNELYYKGLQPNEVLQVNKTHLKFEIGDVSLKLDNLFGGDPIMGEIGNTFLNDNWFEILEEIKPEVSRLLVRLIGSLMNGALESIPADTFLSNRKN